MLLHITTTLLYLCSYDCELSGTVKTVMKNVHHVLSGKFQLLMQTQMAMLLIYEIVKIPPRVLYEIQ
jgi:hypothetical protein